MATCGSLSSLFENPLVPENPTLIESLSSWAQILAKKPVDPASFTEIFGELHFQEMPTISVSSPSSQPYSSSVERSLSLDKSEFIDKNCTINGGKASLDSLLGLPKINHQRSRCETRSNEAFPLKNSDSLQLCTEGLGSESSDEVDDLVVEDGVLFDQQKMIMEDGDGTSTSESSDDYLWREDILDHVDQRGSLVHEYGINGGYSRSCCSDERRRSGRFPPPISLIGRSGKPWICFKSYRIDGRFILREIRIPTQEFLHASRQDGRLKLHLVQPDDEETPADQEDEQGRCQLEEEEGEDQEDNEQVSKGDNQNFILIDCSSID